MAGTEDLIDFDVIETQKENIQSLPGGRSAKSLSLLCSPISTEKSVTYSETQNAKQAVREAFEQELTNIADADDPLDIYDRYIKWTTDAYPSAQATPQSNLLPLLERATKAFLTTSHYKNDARYLKIWLLYIRLFCDAPRETYAFLAKHKIGEQLALFYEEFAAWLEQAGRWSQAEEVYATGIENEARPTDRLVRKYAEFQHRRETKSQTESDGPSSPALPKIRPALAAKIDPFASASTPERDDPQARDRAAAAYPAKSSKSKLAIFADGDEQQSALGTSGSQGWDSIGSIRDRKKENMHEARPWAGETLNGGKKLGGPKMMVFKDEVSHPSLNQNISPFL
jgi:checkpoint serine/threonine-protein kinase